MKRTVRTAARAIIVDGGALLTIKMREPRGVFYILPGGGQRAGETLEETLKRECREELGVEVVPGKFAYLREYIGKNHTFRHIHCGFHQVEVVFLGSLKESLVGPGAGSETDRNQMGWEWIPLEKLGEVPFYPREIIKYFAGGRFDVKFPYLGDVN